MAEVARINSLLGNNTTNMVLHMDRRFQLAVDVPLRPMFNFHLCVKQSHHPYAGVPPTTVFNHRSEFPANLASHYLNRLFSSQLLYIIPIDLLCDANNRLFDYLIASLTGPRAAVIHVKAELTVVFDTADRVQRPPPPAHPRVRTVDSVMIVDDLEEVPPVYLRRRPARRSARDLKERYGLSASEIAEVDNNLGECAVCLEELEVFTGKSSSREVLKMACCHMFHYLCIYKWLKMSDSCPLCRAVIS